MANFNGRKANNLYSHIDNLNALPSEYELTMPQQPNGFDIEADMAIFTNTQFFDFDLGEPDTTNAFERDFSTALQPTHTSSGLDPSLNFMKNDFHLPDFSAYPSLSGTDTASLLPLTHAPAPTQSSLLPSTNTSPTPVPSAAQASAKRKADAETPAPQDDELEGPARFAAEEDKRRRNTAASARFRVKKKQREQAMEKTAKEMTERVNFLESRVNRLEMENKILKDLIVDKGGKADEMVELNKKLARATQKLADEAKSSVEVVDSSSIDAAVEV